MIGIYKITNPKGRVYIGQAFDIYKRWSVYKRRGCSRQPRLYSSFNKYGIDKHKFEVVVECDKNELNELERYYQDIYNCIGKKGLNCVLQKTNSDVRIFSEETRNRMSIAQKGIKHSKERCLKKSIYMKNNPRNKETSLRIAAKTVATRKSNDSYKKTDECKLKQSISMKERHGKSFSIKMRDRMMSMTKEERSRMAKLYAPKKAVINLETGIYYDSATAASESINISVYTLSKKLLGKIKNNTSLRYI